jgi:hypothetical protein
VLACWMMPPYGGLDLLVMALCEGHGCTTRKWWCSQGKRAGCPKAICSNHRLALCQCKFQERSSQQCGDTQ